MKEDKNYLNEELILMSRAKKITEVERNKIRKILIENNESVFDYISNKYYIKGYDDEDKKQEAILSSFKAMVSFDVEKNVKFKTYLTVVIKNDFNKKLRKKIRYEESLNRLTDKGFEVKDQYCLENQVIQNNDIYNINKALKKLTKKEKEILEIVFKKNKGIIGLAKEFNIKYSQARNLKDKVIKRIRDILEIN